MPFGVVDDPIRGGLTPARHEDASYDTAMRTVKYACRIGKGSHGLGGPASAYANLEHLLPEVGSPADSGEATVGDILGLGLWQASKSSKPRDIPAWSHAWACMSSGSSSGASSGGDTTTDATLSHDQFNNVPISQVSDANFPTVTSSGASAVIFQTQDKSAAPSGPKPGGYAAVTPTYGAGSQQDARFATKIARMPPGFPKIPKDVGGIVLTTTNELKQEDVFFPSVPLVSVNAGSDFEAGSAVYDTDVNGRLDNDRFARLQSMMRVVRPGTAGSLNSLAWQHMPSNQDHLDGYGLICAASSGGTMGGGSSPDGSGRTPTGGAATNRTPTGVPIIFGPTTETDALSIYKNSLDVETYLGANGASNAGAARQGYAAPDPGIPQTQSRDGTPSPAGAGSMVLAYMALAKDGPIDPGDARDQHKIGTSLDGDPINPCHIATSSYFRGDGGDAPLSFEQTDYFDPGSLPYEGRVHLRLDRSVSHKSQHGSGGGIGFWTWISEYDKYKEPKKKREDNPIVPDTFHQPDNPIVPDTYTKKPKPTKGLTTQSAPSATGVKMPVGTPVPQDNSTITGAGDPSHVSEGPPPSHAVENPPTTTGSGTTGDWWETGDLPPRPASSGLGDVSSPPQPPGDGGDVQEVHGQDFNISNYDLNITPPNTSVDIGNIGNSYNTPGIAPGLTQSAPAQVDQAFHPGGMVRWQAYNGLEKRRPADNWSGNQSNYKSLVPASGAPSSGLIQGPHEAPRTFLVSTSEESHSSLLMRAHPPDMSDLRNATQVGPNVRAQIQNRSPLVARVEAYGNFPAGGSTTFSRQPGGGRYHGGTSAGGIMIAPADYAVENAYLGTAVPSNLPTPSLTMTGVNLAFGMPNKNGTAASGFSTTLDTSGGGKKLITNSTDGNGVVATGTNVPMVVDDVAKTVTVYGVNAGAADLQHVYQIGAASGGSLSLNTGGGSGPLAISNPVATTTAIAVASNGVALPTATINVTSTVGFASANNTLSVTTGAGVQTVAYTGKTSTTFTGCTGGTGTMATGGTVTDPQIAVTVAQNETTKAAFKITGGLGLTVPGAGASSERVGLAASAAGTSSLAVGNNATADGPSSTCLGTGTTVDAAATGCIAIGIGAHATVSNRLMIGSSLASITTAYIGNGTQANAPASVVFNVTSSSSSSNNGGSWDLRAGAGSTSSSGGDFITRAGAAGTSGGGGNNYVIAGQGSASADGGSVFLATGLLGASPSTHLTVNPNGSVGIGIATISGSALAVDGGSGQVITAARTGSGQGIRLLHANTDTSPQVALNVDGTSGGSISFGTGGATATDSSVGRNSSGDIVMTPATSRSVTTTAPLSVGGTASFAMSALKTTNFSTDDTALHYQVDTSGGSVTATLQTAVGNKGKMATVFKTSASNTLTIQGGGGQTISGLASFAKTGVYQGLTCVSDGANWVCVGEFG